MAYDENTHLSIIRLYSHKLTPFWLDPPPPGAYGPVSTDPSYMYHYLLSFPYRLFSHFFDGLFAQVIFLRIINIALFVVGLIIVRKLLLTVGASRAMINVVIAFLSLLPLTPFLAAQINYDNLLFPASIAAIYFLVKFNQKLRQNVLSAKFLLLMVASCLFASLVMWAFIPIFIAITLVLIYKLWNFKKRIGYKKFKRQLTASFIRIKVLHRWLLVLLVITTLGLFLERYGQNTVRYHSPIPRCNQVLSINVCKLNGPWSRNQKVYKQKLAGELPAVRHDPISYFFGTWLRIMSYQMFFALNGQIKHFKIGSPLPLPFITVAILGIIGTISLALNFRQLFKNDDILVLAIVAGVYMGFLFFKNYSGFLRYGQALAIQGRYLMPVLPIIVLMYALAFRSLLNKLFYRSALSMAVLAILLFQGGGAMVFILRSDVYWYWQNQNIIKVNQKAQQVLETFVIGS